MSPPIRCIEPSPDPDPRISAVIPTYNRAATLERAIRSVLDQTRSADEILVIDDGSTDETDRILASFGRAIRCVRQANGGVGAARRLGLEHARNRWVAFLDSDDRWTCDHLERLADAISQTRGHAALYFADATCSPNEGPSRYWRRCAFDPPAPTTLFTDGADVALLPTQPVLLQSSAIDRHVALGAADAMASLRTREDTLLIFWLALSRPACAVRHVGVALGTDGGAQLTRVHASTSPTYVDATITLYRVILATFGAGHGVAGRVLRARLHAAYLGAIVQCLRRLELRAALATSRRAWVDCGPRIGVAALLRAIGSVRRRFVVDASFKSG